MTSNTTVCDLKCMANNVLLEVIYDIEVKITNSDFYKIKFECVENLKKKINKAIYNGGFK